MQHRVFTLLCILLALHFSITAQPAEIIFRHYSVSEGFTSNDALDIVQTNEGLLWVSSGDGLARFDSKTFKFYRHNNKDTNSIAHNYCSTMQVDNRGWIWIVVDGDIDIFNPDLETFRHIKMPGNSGAKIFPKDFYYDKEKDIMWIATASGLFFSKGGSGKLETVAKITNDAVLIKNTIFSIAAQDNDQLWITSNSKLVKLNTRTGITQTHAVPAVLNGKSNGGNIYFTSIYLHKNNMLWMGATGLGLFSFNIATGQFEQYNYRDVKKQDNTVISINQTGLPGQEDILFVGTTGLGFAAFDIITKKFTSYGSVLNSSYLGIKGNAYGLYNRNNKMWIGSSTGLHCYDYSLQLFEKKDISSISDGVTLLPIEQMAIERNNYGKDERLWLFVPYKDAYIYDLSNNAILPVPAAIKKYTATDAGIFSLYIDSKNQLWIATNRYGLVRYDIAADKIISEREFFYNNREWAHHFFEDSRSNIWICTYKGLFKMDSGSKALLPVTVVNELLERNHLSNSIVSITGDEYGMMWITADFSRKKNAAILKLDPLKNKADIIYREDMVSSNNNPAVDIREICSNKKGKIFASFRNEHILWFKSNSAGKIISSELGRQEGLNSTAIDQLLADTSGNIWCSNSLGIAQYKSRENSFNNYSFANYELNTSNNPFIYISPNSGRFYIGQSNSFLLFNYAGNGNDINNTTLLFNELKIYNTSYPHKIRDGDHINLNHRQDMISIDFALLSYSNASENTYSWMLEGLEKEWNISKSNIATYNHLVPGKYTLYVKAANSNGDWKAAPIKLYITITPPFYATWWFIVICVLLLAALVWWIVKRRIRRIKEKFELRNSIASDLHDEIGSTLTSINILSNVSQQAMEQQPQQAKELLQQISSQSKTIQQNMSDIVWSIRPDNEKTENLVVRVREYAAHTLEPLQISTIIEADDSLISKILPMQYRKDILLICKEAINNIAKHANATSVCISFHHTKKNITLTIADNGQWKGDNSGTGTKTMKERANALGGQLSIHTTAAGTKVVLVIRLP